jgi:acylphosphatase
MSDLSAVTAVVSGIVQGVGYRYATRARARMLGLRGWVRNRQDGAVEVFLQGPASAVQDMVLFLHSGPPHAVVDNVDLVAAEPDPHLPGFDVRF